jgi:hypothetical protein
MDSTQLQFWNDIFTGAYVVLTLIIAGTAIRSLFLTRQQIEINKKQSEDALITSERQSQAAMQAVHEQIQTSEKQNRELIENQFKPFLIPIMRPISNNATTYTIGMTNQGAGVALHAWGLLTERNLPQVHYCKEAHLVKPHEERETAFRFGDSDVVYQQGMFAGYPLFLRGSENDIKETLRLTLTYSDIFTNNFLVIFDYNEQFGWQLIAFQKVVKRLDELVVKKQ